MSILLSRKLSIQIGIVVLAIAGSCAASLALDERSMALPFSLAVAIAACAGRRRMGLVATILGALSIQWLSHGKDILGTSVFLLVGFLISLAIDRLARELEIARMGQDQVRGNEEKLRLLVDSVGDYALCLLDADGRVANWNSGAERLLGYPPDDIVGRHVCCLYADAAVEAGEPIQELELAQAVGRCERRDWKLRRDGTRLRTHMVLTAIHDGHGQLRGYAIVMRELIVAPSPRSLTGLLDEHRHGLELALTNRT